VLWPAFRSRWRIDAHLWTLPRVGQTRRGGFRPHGGAAWWSLVGAALFYSRLFWRCGTSRVGWSPVPAAGGSGLARSRLVGPDLGLAGPCQLTILPRRAMRASDVAVAWPPSMVGAQVFGGQILAARSRSGSGWSMGAFLRMRLETLQHRASIVPPCPCLVC
jgi:hypothetical protein